MLKSFLLSLLVVITMQISAQTDSTKTWLVQDTRIQTLLDKKTAVNEKTHGKIQGYRIQIHFGSERDKAKEIKSKFLTAYPDVPAYDPYEQPNFKIRVGDFRTKLEAYQFLKQISTDFPGAFIVQDNIELPKVELGVSSQ